MTDDEAMRAVGHLVGGLNGFSDANVVEYHDQFVKLDDAEALDEVCGQIVRTWTDRWKPTVGDVIGAYHAHPRVRAEREARVAAAMLDEWGGRIVPFAEGQAIANDSYRSLYGRNMGEAPIPNPEYAENLIVNEGRRDRYGNWVATYHAVLRGFRGDTTRAQVSLKAIGPRRLAHDMRGNLTLRPPDEPPMASTPPPSRPAETDAAAPPPPSERPPDPSSLMTEALGKTISRLEGDQ